MASAPNQAYVKPPFAANFGLLIASPVAPAQSKFLSLGWKGVVPGKSTVLMKSARPYLLQNYNNQSHRQVIPGS